MGCHTFRFAKLVGSKGKVIAFEPISRAFTKLKRNMELNNFNNLTIEKIALSNENKDNQSVEFRVSWPLKGKKHKTKDVVEDIINFVTLDEYIKKNSIIKIDMIKLDVDGYEFKVIEGAIETLKLHKPIIIMELGPFNLEKVSDNITDLVSLLQNIGYKFYSEKDMKMYSNTDEMLKTIPKGSTINVILSTNNL